MQRTNKKRQQVLDVLEHVLVLLKPPGAWIQGAFKRRVKGKMCHCLIGAIDYSVSCECCLSGYRLSGYRLSVATQAAVYRTLRLKTTDGVASIVCWNDEPKRTKRQVLTVVRDTITRLKREVRTR
jgi:hypothetical protein